jgi:hypothetical protein
MATTLLLIVAAFMFGISLLAGFLIGCPHNWISPEAIIWHRLLDCTAAMVCGYGIYLGLQSGMSVTEMTGFQLQHFGSSLITGSVIPIGFMLTYGNQLVVETMTPSGAMLFASFFGIPLFFLACGVFFLVITLLMHAPGLRRFCTIRTNSCF